MPVRPQNIKNLKANVHSNMKGDRLIIAIKDVSKLAKGLIITGRINSGRISLNQKVYLHDTANGKPISCIIVDIRVNDKFVSQASKNANLTSYILGPSLNDIVIGKSYISASAQPIQISIPKKKTKSFSSPQGTMNNPPKGKLEKDDKRIETTAKTSQKTIQFADKIISSEKEILDCIKHCLRDEGCISSSEKYVLYKIAEANNIAKKRCEELLTQCIKSYNSERAISIFEDAVKTCLLDSNYISETEIFLLERLRISLNIPENVAHKIFYKYSWEYSDTIQ